MKKININNSTISSSTDSEMILKSTCKDLNTKKQNYSFEACAVNNIPADTSLNGYSITHSLSSLQKTSEISSLYSSFSKHFKYFPTVPDIMPDVKITSADEYILSHQISTQTNEEKDTRISCASENGEQITKHDNQNTKPRNFLYILKTCRDLVKQHVNPYATFIEQKHQKKLAKMKAMELFPHMTLQHVMELAISSDDVYEKILEVAEKLKRQELPAERQRNLSQYSFLFLRSEPNENRLTYLNDLLQGKKSIKQLNREHHLRHTLLSGSGKKRKSPSDREQPIVNQENRFNENYRQHFVGCCNCHVLRQEIETLKEEMSNMKDEIMKQLICAQQM